MKAQVGKNGAGGYKIILVPETNIERHMLDRQFEELLKAWRVAAVTSNILQGSKQEVGITLVAEEEPIVKRREVQGT